MEEKENVKAAEAKECAKNAEVRKCSGDFRTFLIALLTSVIVLAVYHFGTGLCAILSGTSSYGCMPVTREYVLVPVSAMPCGEGPCMMGRGPGRKGGPAGRFRKPGRHFEKGNRPMNRPPFEEGKPEMGKRGPEGKQLPPPAPEKKSE